MDGCVIFVALLLDFSGWKLVIVDSLLVDVGSCGS